MDDQRIIRRPSLGGKYIQHGFGVQGIRAQPVYRFGGEPYQFSFSDQFGSQCDPVGIGRQQQGLHACPPLFGTPPIISLRR